MGHNGFYRFTRYLILWGIGLLVLCILAFIRNWDTVTAVFSSLMSSLISGIVTLVIIAVVLRGLFH